jgi:hypothetical protein
MMSDLGDRMNVMGPQPIIKRFVIPPEMIAAAERVLTLLAASDTAAVASMAAPGREADLSALAAAVKAGIYDRHQIIATARVNFHHYVKARLYGPRVEPFTMQLRLGEHNGEWRVWEAQNLTGRRGAWTR